MEYVVHISRGSDNVATNAVEADGDAQAFNLAIEWAASLLLAADDDVVLAYSVAVGRLQDLCAERFLTPKCAAQNS